MSKIFTAEPVDKDDDRAANAAECQCVTDTAHTLETTHENVSEASVGWRDDG